jgi:hypothetical protein
MKFGWKHYFAPTPKRVRVLGDSLAAAGTFGAGIVILNGHPDSWYGCYGCSYRRKVYIKLLY